MLFTQKGVAATTISEIAQSVGLRQSSMYYYYRSKEEILAAVMEKNRESLKHGQRLTTHSGPAAPRLYAFSFIDLRQLCTAPLDFYELETSAVAQPQVFEGFEADYASLRGVVEQLIGQGVKTGELRTPNPERAALMLLAGNEGAQHRFFHALPVDDRPEVEDLAREITDHNVSALLADTSTLDAVREAGLGLVPTVSEAVAS